MIIHDISAFLFQTMLGELPDGVSEDHFLFCRLFVPVEKLSDVCGFGIACVDDYAVF